MTSGPTAAIITLGRDQGLGELRRVESWQMILSKAGFRPTVIRLRRDCRPSLRRRPDLASVIAGTAPPETLSWSPAAARARLSTIEPTVSIFVTLRAFVPGLVDPAGTAVLDFVDQLSVSYADRAVISDRWWSRQRFRLLAAAMRRVEEHQSRDVIQVAAGRADAEVLDALWFPNVMDIPEPEHQASPTHDLVFFGNLAYPPNIAAVIQLCDWWDDVQRTRPGTSLLITGRNPTARVVAAARSMGADLEPGFADPISAARRARVAVSPLAHVAGIQNKVIEAAAAGVPQVLTPEALSGLPRGFPCMVAATGDLFAQAINALLERPESRHQLAAAARTMASQVFSPTEQASRLLEALTR